ncbi:MAG: PrgI family protein [Candidatus Vogelbacteria bacterium]|nr:PrgI family protein [Candidatus Vogelbacteria bacterium]
MQFQVPQFIEMEDKIFGPLTFKQFLYIVGGLALAFIFYVYLGFWLALIPMLAIVGFAGALAFYKFNGRSFIYLVEALFNYLRTKKLYIWKQDKRLNNQTARPIQVVDKNNPNIPKLSKSKLEELTWSLDIRDKSPEEQDNG